MSTITTMSNEYLKQKLYGDIHLDSDTIRIILLRSGFEFNRANHQKLINIRTNTGALNLTFVAATSKITRAAGSFVTDGFVEGNQVTSDAALNPGPFTILSVSALEIVVVEAVADEAAVGVTLSSDDELQTGSGYTQFDKALVFDAITKDDDLSLASATWEDAEWTAGGGDIGPASGAMLIDDTHADDVIIMHMQFSADQTAADTEKLRVNDITVIEEG